MAINLSNCDLEQASFVEVLDEPCHKPFIQNSRINVFIAKLARNNTTLYHRHKENTVYVVIAGSLCRTQVLGSDVRAQEYLTGDCFTAEHRLKPMIHRVECLNESPSDAWFVGSEILQDKAFDSDMILEHKHCNPISTVNVPGCRVYRMKLSSQETTGNHLLKTSGVFISLINGELQINCDESSQHFPLASGIIDMGHVTWFDGPVQFEIRNVGSVSYEAILLLLS